VCITRILHGVAARGCQTRRVAGLLLALVPTVRVLHRNVEALRMQEVLIYVQQTLSSVAACVND
jgi:hypothetical protein